MTLREKILAAAFDRLSDFAADVRDAITGDTDPGGGADRPGAGHHTHPDAPAVAARAWRGVFASDVKEGDLVAVDGRYFSGPPGRRALLITGRREDERAGLLGATMQAITFLFTDLDSDRSDSITVASSAALEVEVRVPDSVPTDLGGEQ